MKFGILGNCQVRGIRECLQKLAPDHQFEALQVERLQTDDAATLNRIVELAASVDILFAHATDVCVARPGPQQVLNAAMVKAQPRYVVTIPGIYFSGFHPDCCYIDCNGEYLATAAFNYHSSIIAGAYLSGLPARRVPSLFNRFVYAGLGYLGGLELHEQNLLLHFARLGFDARPILESSGVFMHCPNHPFVAALFELATQMLWRVGIAPASATPPEDWMQKHALRWPVYPGLRDGSEDARVAMEFLHGSRVISLDELIDSSYDCYARHQFVAAQCSSASVNRATLFLGQQVR